MSLIGWVFWIAACVCWQTSICSSQTQPPGVVSAPPWRLFGLSSFYPRDPALHHCVLLILHEQINSLLACWRTTICSSQSQPPVDVANLNPAPPWRLLLLASFCDRYLYHCALILHTHRSRFIDRQRLDLLKTSLQQIYLRQREGNSCSLSSVLETQQFAIVYRFYTHTDKQFTRLLTKKHLLFPNSASTRYICAAVKADWAQICQFVSPL